MNLYDRKKYLDEIDSKKLLQEHYAISKGRRCGTEHIIGEGYKIVIYDHDAIHLDSPAKARLELAGRNIYHVTAKEPEELDFIELFKKGLYNKNN